MPWRNTIPLTSTVPRCTWSSGNQSEVILQADLHGSRIPDGAADHAERCQVGQAARRRVEVGMVERVVHLQPEIEVLLFSSMKLLADGQIEVLVARSDFGAFRSRSEGAWSGVPVLTSAVVHAGCRANRNICSEPVIDVRVLVIETAVAVRPKRSTNNLIAGVAPVDGHREPGMDTGDEVHLPAAGDQIGRPVHVPAEGPVAAHGQLIIAAEAEDVRGVEEGSAVIAMAVISILEVRALASRGSGGAVVAQVIRQRLAKGVGRVEIQTSAVTLAGGHLEAVVVHDGAG